MKFSNIEKFTNTSGIYHIDQALSHFENWINTHIDQGLQLIPNFQREHVWNEEQQIKYMEYLFRGGKSGKELYFNHPKYTSGELTKEGEFVCVDGLQRITAILRFLHNEIPVFDGVYLKNFEDRLCMADVYLSININELKTKQQVLKWYIEMNDGGTPHTKEEIDRVKELYNKEK